MMLTTRDRVRGRRPVETGVGARGECRPLHQRGGFERIVEGIGTVVVLADTDDHGSTGIERHEPRLYEPSAAPSRFRPYTRPAMARIAIGSDHAGYDLKAHLVTFLTVQGHDVDDQGTHSTDSVDYPAICAGVGRTVVAGDADWGIVLGGSGQGEQLAANKVRGVRAALCNCLYTARMAREHNDANVLSIGARVVGVGLAEEIVTTFATAEFEGGRHQRRVDQITALEADF